jgi:hypothetical protein
MDPFHKFEMATMGCEICHKDIKHRYMQQQQQQQQQKQNN